MVIQLYNEELNLIFKSEISRKASTLKIFLSLLKYHKHFFEIVQVLNYLKEQGFKKRTIFLGLSNLKKLGLLEKQGGGYVMKRKDYHNEGNHNEDNHNKGNHNKGYIKIGDRLREVIAQSNLNEAELEVMFYLLGVINKRKKHKRPYSKTFFITKDVKNLAGFLGLNIRTVYRAIEGLKGKGYLGEMSYGGKPILLLHDWVIDLIQEAYTPSEASSLSYNFKPSHPEPKSEPIETKSEPMALAKLGDKRSNTETKLATTPETSNEKTSEPLDTLKPLDTPEHKETSSIQETVQEIKFSLPAPPEEPFSQLKERVKMDYHKVIEEERQELRKTLGYLKKEEAKTVKEREAKTIRDLDPAYLSINSDFLQRFYVRALINRALLFNEEEFKPLAILYELDQSSKTFYEDAYKVLKSLEASHSEAPKTSSGASALSGAFALSGNNGKTNGKSNGIDNHNGNGTTYHNSNGNGNGTANGNGNGKDNFNEALSRLRLALENEEIRENFLNEAKKSFDYIKTKIDETMESFKKATDKKGYIKPALTLRSLLLNKQAFEKNYVIATYRELLRLVLIFNNPAYKDLALLYENEEVYPKDWKAFFIELFNLLEPFLNQSTTTPPPQPKTLAHSNAYA